MLCYVLAMMLPNPNKIILSMISLFEQLMKWSPFILIPIMLLDEMPVSHCIQPQSDSLIRFVINSRVIEFDVMFSKGHMFVF